MHTLMHGRPTALLAAVGGTALAALLSVALLSRAGPGALLQRNFFFGDSGMPIPRDVGAVGRVQELAGAEASMGKSGAGVKALLKRELNNQVHAREALRYTNALKMGGLDVDPAAEKTILTAFKRSKRGPSSLAVSSKLQKQVVIAGVIAGKGTVKSAARGAARHAASSDKLRLAEAIMSGHSGPTGGMRKAKVATRPAAKHAAMQRKKTTLQRKKTTFKRQMKAQLEAKTSALEKKDLKAVLHRDKPQPKAMKPLQNSFAKQMMAQLNQKAQHMAASAWHSQVKAVSSKELATAQWGSAKRAEAKGMGIDTTLYSKGGGKTPALTVGSSSDNTEISVSDGAHADRLRLEREMMRELNSKASAIERKDFDAIASASMPKAYQHKETDLVKKLATQAASQPRMRLEKTLEKSIRSIDYGREEALYHAGLVKEKFDGAVVSSKAIDH